MNDICAIKQPCITCGNPADAHHEDYDKPLDVIWYCPHHHLEHHRKLKNQGGNLVNA